jgi:hypothetical protein
MKSQVQVLAGPPLFSQLRGLTRLARWRSLLAWAAPGPRPLFAPSGPRGLPERATRSPGRSQRAPIVVATGSAQVMVGLMPATLALTTCGAMPPMGCTARGRCSSTDGRSWRATGVSLTGQAVEPGPLPERLPRRRPGPARRRRWPSTARAGSEAPALARAAARAVRGYGRAARPRPSWPCGCPPRRRAPGSHPVRTPRTPMRNTDTDAGRRTSTSRTLDIRTLDTGRVDIARASARSRARRGRAGGVEGRVQPSLRLASRPSSPCPARPGRRRSTRPSRLAAGHRGGREAALTGTWHHDSVAWSAGRGGRSEPATTAWPLWQDPASNGYLAEGSQHATARTDLGRLRDRRVGRLCGAGRAGLSPPAPPLSLARRTGFWSWSTSAN